MTYFLFPMSYFHDSKNLFSILGVGLTPCPIIYSYWRAIQSCSPILNYPLIRLEMPVIHDDDLIAEILMVIFFITKIFLWRLLKCCGSLNEILFSYPRLFQNIYQNFIVLHGTVWSGVCLKVKFFTRNDLCRKQKNII